MAIASSIVSPCVMHPGRSGTVTTYPPSSGSCSSKMVYRYILDIDLSLPTLTFRSQYIIIYETFVGWQQASPFQSLKWLIVKLKTKTRYKHLNTAQTYHVASGCLRPRVWA